MQILITGGRGQLGLSLTQLLESLGYTVIAPGKEELDVTNLQQVDNAFNSSPDCVIHCAAWTDVNGCQREPDTAFKINSYGTGLITAHCARRRIPLVYLSTDYVFKGNKKIPYLATDSPRAINIYGRSKLAGEKMVERIHYHPLIIRTSWLYGNKMDGFIPRLLQLGERKKCLKVVNDQHGRPTWCRDLAAGIISLLKMKGDGLSLPPRGIYHLANRGETSRYGLVRELVKFMGWEVEVRQIKSEEYQDYAPRPGYSVLDLSRAQRMGVVLRPWNKALREFLTERRDGKDHGGKDCRGQREKIENYSR